MTELRPAARSATTRSGRRPVPDRRGIARARLVTTLLADHPPVSPTAVVDRLTAVQSQEAVLARWSVGARSGVDEATVLDLLHRGDLLRTHVLRPTWHYVRPGDLRALLDLTGPRVSAAIAGAMRRLGLPPAVRERFRAMVRDLLAGGRWATRDDLAGAAAGIGILVDRLGLTHLLMDAELTGVLCSGPVPEGVPRPDGRHHTYALLDDRVPAAPTVDRRTAVADLTVRYLAGHGPATLRDLAWWSSLTLTELRVALTDVRDLVQDVEVEGRRYWGPPGWADRAAEPDGAHLLQMFDEFVGGHVDSRDVLDLAGIGRMVGADRGRDGHPVVLDGQVVGHWRLRIEERGTRRLRVVPRRALRAGEAASVRAAAEAAGEFLGASAVETARFDD